MRIVGNLSLKGKLSYFTILIIELKKADVFGNQTALNQLMPF